MSELKVHRILKCVVKVDVDANSRSQAHGDRSITRRVLELSGGSSDCYAQNLRRASG